MRPLYLSAEEYHKFRIAIGGQPVEKLTALFNMLSAEKTKAETPEADRHKIEEKLKMIETAKMLSRLGGSQG